MVKRRSAKMEVSLVEIPIPIKKAGSRTKSIVVPIHDIQISGEVPIIPPMGCRAAGARPGIH